jgi:hypothetical protein
MWWAIVTVLIGEILIITGLYALQIHRWLELPEFVFLWTPVAIACAIESVVLCRALPIFAAIALGGAISVAGLFVALFVCFNTFGS